MPASYTIDRERGVLLTVFEGVVTLEEVKSIQAAVRADPQFDPKLKSLTDMTRLTMFTASSDQVRSVLSASPIDRESRRALITSPGLSYGFGRMAETMSGFVGGPQTRTFSTEAEALEWLGLKTVSQ